jgi:hypothetical protein
MQSTDHQGKRHRDCDVGLLSHGSAQGGVHFQATLRVVDTPLNTRPPALPGCLQETSQAHPPYRCGGGVQ